MDRLGNLRDVSSASPALRPALLLRSDAPLHGDDHTHYSVAWPPLTVVDLRGRGERGGLGHPLDTANVAVWERPLLRGMTYPAPREVADLQPLYRTMVESPVAERLVEAVGLIAHSEPPVLVHCTAGKDRTGVLVAITLRLLDIDAESVVSDYIATTGSMGRVITRMRGSLTHVLPADVLRDPPPAFLTAPEDAIRVVVELLDQEKQGASGWYLANGGTRSTLDVLRERLLAGPSSR